MAQKKKLQVFVSSTYTDLKEERQAAVEAILTAGHIPAGMELFAAGDESQVNAIKRWIDESDVFLLILGGRYGSIDPKTGKSYIQMEYEYAIERAKPLFAVVIEANHLEEKVKQYGTMVIEMEHTEKLKAFRDLVLTKLVRFWSEPRDIKLAILETMSDFSRREDLVGWIPGDEGIKAGALTEEIARLARENEGLREQVMKSTATSAQVTYNGLTYEELSNMLLQEPIKLPLVKALHASLPADLLVSPNLLSLFWFLKDEIAVGLPDNHGLFGEVRKLVSFGLAELTGDGLKLSEDGSRFLARLRLTKYSEDSKVHTASADLSPNE